METLTEYLTDWWAGDVGRWRLLGLQMSQVNKIAKAVQYVAGLTALFEFISYTAVVHTGRTMAFFAILTLSVWRLLSFIPLYVGLLIVRIIHALRHRKGIRLEIESYYTQTKHALNQSAERSFAVKIFDWLLRRPVGPRTFRIAAFAIFVVFSLIDLLTS